MTTSRIWRFSLLAAALPWVAVPACGGRTGDYDLPDGVFTPSNGGAGTQVVGAAGAARLGSSDTNRGTANNTGVSSATTSNPVGASSPPPTSVVGRGGRSSSNPGSGVILPPPPIGAGGAVFPPPFGTGGFFGAAGASFGGTGGVMQCSAPGSPIAEVCVPPSLPITTCCTQQGRCGLQLFPDSMVATNIPLVGGCQPMNQPGYDYLGCPDLGALVGQPETNVTLSACCRYDGTCGLDLSVVGAGCVQSTKAGKPIPCGPIDAGVIDASIPPIDAGAD